MLWIGGGGAPSSSRLERANEVVLPGDRNSETVSSQTRQQLQAMVVRNHEVDEIATRMSVCEEGTVGTAKKEKNNY